MKRTLFNWGIRRSRSTKQASGPMVWVKRGVLACGVLVVAGAAGWLSAGGPQAQHVITTVQQLPDTVTTALHLRLEVVELTGRENAHVARVMQALNIKRGTPIYDIDLGAARDRIEALGWVETAHVERQLPDRLMVNLTERRPFAVWQSQGRFHLVDPDGVQIRSDVGPEWHALPHVVGQGAVENLKDIVGFQNSDERAAATVASYVRVGDRRWDVILQSGLVVQLPEEKAVEAWVDFQVLADDVDFKRRPIVAVDMRLPDQVTFRLSTDAAERLKRERQS